MGRFPACVWMAGGWMVLALSGIASAQEPVDPPSRVARLNFMAGNVSYRPAGVEEWGAATMNYPLTTGDHLWTDDQGGAELHVGSAALRLAGSTAFEVLNLDDRITQVSVAQGFMNIRLRRLDDGEAFEVDTPNGAIAILQPGDYRVGVDPESNSTRVCVRAGAVEVTGGSKTFSVDEHRQVRFTGTDQVDAESLEPPSPDQWDEWCANRDQLDDRAEQEVTPYVGNEMIGAEDLANNGQWRDDSQYGHYWVPTGVAVGWAPYRYGHWAYVMPWGWTWIDDASWGFAPFHYGRWAMIGGGWGWVPGTVVRRPVYAPALVAFVGGGGFGAAIGIGGGVGVAAWVPLGPREVYRPYYRVSDNYVRQVNITHVNVTNINVTNVTYVNRTYVTAVRQDTFVGARPVGTGFVRVPPSAVANIRQTDIGSYRPAHEAYMGRPAGGMRVSAPPQQVVSRTVIVRSAPPASVQSRASIRVASPTTVREVPRGYQPAYRAPGNTGNQPGGKYQGNPGNQPGGQQPNYRPGNQGNQPTGNQPGGNQPGGKQPYYKPGNQGNQPTGNQPSGNQPVGKQPYYKPGNQGNQPTGNPPSGNQPTGNPPGGRPPQPGNTGTQPPQQPQQRHVDAPRGKAPQHEEKKKTDKK
jgi:hypothetical protein